MENNNTVDINENFRKNFREQRLVRGMNLVEFAKFLGTSHQNVARWESGERSPTVDKAKLIADQLGMSIEELMGIEPIQSTPSNDELWELRDAMRRNPEMRMLFSLAKNASGRDLKACAMMLRTLKGEDADDV